MPITNWKAQVYSIIKSLLYNNPHRVVHHLERQADGTLRERSEYPAPEPRLAEQDAPPERTCLRTLQFVHHFIIPPGGRHVAELHTHPDAEELIIILDGSGRMTIGDEIREVIRGDFVYVPPDTEHELYNDSENLLTSLLVNAPVGEGIDRLKEEQDADSLTSE
jgi:quercetin dioxygenase-like cupin family protein